VTQSSDAACPLSAVLISVSDITRSISFYRDVIGLNVVEETVLRESDFAFHWKLPMDTSAKVVCLQGADIPVGRVLLLQFDPASPEFIRRELHRSFFGLFNINFYVDDMQKAVTTLKKLGYAFWGEPVVQKMSAEVGNPLEVVFEGPDRIPVNLVELPNDGGQTRTGRNRLLMDQAGKTDTGFTPVATSSVYSAAKDDTVAFYTHVLGYTMAIDEIMERPESNALLGWPQEGRTQIAFLDPGHLYGKIGIAQPLNFDIADFTEEARPPRLGYFAQSFAVNDLNSTLQRCDDINAPVLSPPSTMKLPGYGNSNTAVVHLPSTGSLIELVERL